MKPVVIAAETVQIKDKINSGQNTAPVYVNIISAHNHKEIQISQTH